MDVSGGWHRGAQEERVLWVCFHALGTRRDTGCTERGWIFDSCPQPRLVTSDLHTRLSRRKGWCLAARGGSWLPGLISSPEHHQDLRLSLLPITHHQGWRGTWPCREPGGRGSLQAAAAMAGAGQGFLLPAWCEAPALLWAPPRPGPQGRSCLSPELSAAQCAPWLRQAPSSVLLGPAAPSIGASSGIASMPGLCSNM